MRVCDEGIKSLGQNMKISIFSYLITYIDLNWNIFTINKKTKNANNKEYITVGVIQRWSMH